MGKIETIPGWTINIEETSNGVFKVILTDEYGHRAEIIDNATDETVEKAISAAFDIEKQISKNWSLFLFNLCIEKLTTENIVNKEYNSIVFGSWFIEGAEKRLVYEGKDKWLIVQTKTGAEWLDNIIIKKDELKYLNLIEQIKNI